ncbi:putative glycerophosphoryl diester phosphodiesterase YhdW [Thalassobacillus devorans]|uniref:Glycerophosphoryl diester phosphodiesterase YhdW n=1 Tax=Thalassobacillus devorans TaxID=279813 RepID=A0ABQ1PMZ8_9BACI|nr:glycerophosphodiester phosphodiesterase family protein [Thalassobacillus devorans]NIK30469.1 glycerophosphoryl diester phosphodiesterase [Thalassobacillus devorans]GGD00044.1 putative glycerophosphoryl diester phosphodiesterase YhdW [Thalassobacillus devorans]
MKQWVSALSAGAIAIMVLFAPGGIAFASEGIATKDQNQVLNIAHRGASGYAPENTMAAFEKSVEMKADMFELDVQMSKDGELVVIHDTTVDRTTDGTGSVKDLTLEELKSLDAGSWFDESFTSETIPTLGEVLDEYRGRTGILIELKSPSLYPGIEQKVADELKARHLDNPENEKIIVQSFNHESVQTFHDLLPQVPVGVLLGYSPEGISDEQLDRFKAYADYVNPSKSMIDALLVERIHDYNMKTHPWTVRDRESANFLLEAGADGIITDYPDYVAPHPSK